MKKQMRMKKRMKMGMKRKIALGHHLCIHQSYREVKVGKRRIGMERGGEGKNKKTAKALAC